MSIRDIPLERIERNPNQPRETFPEEHILRLADSIKTRGLIQPITVRPIVDSNRYMIVAGECRYRAHVHLKKLTIRCIVASIDDQEMQLRAIVENLQRKDMNALEEAKAFKTLMDAGFSVQRIVDELGLRSTSIVMQRLKLLDLTAEIQKLVVTGQLSTIMAWGVAQAPAEFQSRLIREIASGKLRTAEQVKRAGWALRDAVAQQDAFADMPRASRTQLAAANKLENKIEQIVAMIQAGFKDGECIAALRVSPDKVRIMADKLSLIRKHVLQMEHDLRRVATQTELLMEHAS